MIICFKEKHEDRFVEGDCKEDILAQVLQERINDTYGRLFRTSNTNSIWYEDETEKAQQALENGQAVQFMTARRSYEYENWFEIKE